MTTTLTNQNMEDILNGACVLGCGGGGPLVVGHQLLKLVREQGEVVLASPDEVPDDASVAVSAVAGSPNAAVGGPFPFRVAIDAFNGLAERLQTDFSHVLPIEVGAGNSFIPMFAAAIRGIPLVDASGAPRAMPLFDMATYAGTVATSPVVIADDHTSIFYDATERQKGGGVRSETEVADQVSRAIMTTGAFPGFAGVAMASMSGKDLKAHACLGTMSRALRVGERIRAAKESGDSPVEAVADELGGKVLFVADEITEVETTGGGFDHGTITMRGANADVRLIAQNETILGFRSDSAEPIGIGPDFLCYLTEDGQPFSNATADIQKYAAGKKVALIGAPASGFNYDDPAIIETWMGVARGLGYGGSYVPIEELSAWSHVDIDLTASSPADEPVS